MFILFFLDFFFAWLVESFILFCACLSDSKEVLRVDCSYINTTPMSSWCQKPSLSIPGRSYYFIFLLYTDFHLLCFSLLRKKGWVDITHILCFASLTRIFIILANFRVEVDSSTTWKLSCWDFCVGGQFYLKNRSMH